MIKKPLVILLIDGLDPEYLEVCEAPVIETLMREGFFEIGKCVMPSVTNVNNVSLVTASYSELHGICSNYWLRGEGDEIYLESGEYIKAETMFQRAKKQGKKSLFVTAKNKLLALLADGATIAISAEQPPEQLVKNVGAPPGIYSLEVNEWVIDTANHIMTLHDDIELVYITTTDFAMHKYAPEHPKAHRHMRILDEAIERLLTTHPDITLLITADHGMSAKSRMIHLPGELFRKQRIQIRAIPVIKDRHTVHHSNLGGCIYVYLEDSLKLGHALMHLRRIDGVEEALPRYEAATKYHLMPDRIGDIVVMGEKDVVFGNPEEVEMPDNLRSHGSLHETTVPIIGHNGDFDGFTFQENRDVGRYVFERVLI